MTIEKFPIALKSELKEVDNNLKREIANLNLQLEANKRVKNGVTFGTNFADSFGMEIDTARTSSDEALEVGQTVITVRDASDFKVGTEVTIYDDVNLERVNIASIDGNEIALETALTKDYKEGVNVARSMVVDNPDFKEMSFGNWGTYQHLIIDNEKLENVPSIQQNTLNYTLVRAGDSWYKLRKSDIKIDRLRDNHTSWEEISTLSFPNNGIKLETDDKYLIVVHRTSINSTYSIKILLDGALVDSFDIQISSSNAVGSLSIKFNKKTRRLYLFTTISPSQANYVTYMACFSISNDGKVSQFGDILPFISAIPYENYRYRIIHSIAKPQDMIFEDDRILVGFLTLQHYTNNSAYAEFVEINNEFTSATSKSNIYVAGGNALTDASFFKYNDEYVFVFGSNQTSTSNYCHVLKSTDAITWSKMTFSLKSIISSFYKGDGYVWFMSTQKLYGMNIDTDTTAVEIEQYSTTGSIDGIGFYVPSDSEVDRPFTMHEDASLFNGSGVVGYGDKITVNDLRFKIKPSKEVVTWLQHDNGLTVTEATFGNINLDLSTLDDETQAVGYTTIEQDEVRLTIERPSIDVDPKITRILGGTS